MYVSIYFFILKKKKIKSDISLAEKLMPQLVSRVVSLAPLN